MHCHDWRTRGLALHAIVFAEHLGPRLRDRLQLLKLSVLARRKVLRNIRVVPLVFFLCLVPEVVRRVPLDLVRKRKFLRLESYVLGDWEEPLVRHLGSRGQN